MDLYLKGLLSHIKELAPTMRDYHVDTIYFGGGTPSYFGEVRLRKVLSALKHHFAISKTPEVTVECNPDSVDKKLLLKLKKAGFNRFSLGMQSADSHQLACLGRPHTVQKVADAIALMRACKIYNISLDLLYGLPAQTLESCLTTLDSALRLAPVHLSFTL